MAVFLESTGKDFCDINLMLEGRVIPAHKSILSARTQYFQGMFRSFMPLDNTVNVGFFFDGTLITTYAKSLFILFSDIHW